MGQVSPKPTLKCFFLNETYINIIKEILFFQKRRLAICERSYASENRPLNVYNVFQNYGETSGVHSANFYNRTCLGIKGTIH